MFYSTTYSVPDFAPLYVGSSHGFDASDPRYRWNDEPYGNWATPIYTHPNHSSATLFLGSAHIATLDPGYMACMNVKATVNIAAKNWHHMDMMPYWRDPSENGIPWRPYPNLSLSQHDIWDLRMTEMDWVKYWWSIEDFVDRYMEAGHSVFFHDHKGCRGGAAAAMYYAMKKQGIWWKEMYEEVLAKRPCVSALRVREWPNRWHLERLKELSPPGGPTTTTETTTATVTETATEAPANDTLNYTVDSDLDASDFNASDSSASYASEADTSDNSTTTTTITTTSLVYSR
uniref:Tyrosine specific protein phosphatases domain-containing protein n=1 Tax=Alexandrium catenella TaxID=2925 RepID=A0A7S1L310_ALECA